MLQPWGKRFGAAVDIGTTTLAMYLYDLASGEQLYTAARRNPQAVYGADVISRLEKSLGGERQELAGLHPAGAWPRCWPNAAPVGV